MSFLWMFFIIFTVLIIPFVIWEIKSQWESIAAMFCMILFAVCSISFLIAAIVQPISLKKEALRQDKERQQIVYQIENLTEDSDKIKLNEWILTYNDWVNDINTNKEIYGYVSWYYFFDMSEHTIINLV